MQDSELREQGFPKVWDDTMRKQAAQCRRRLYFFLRRFDYATRPAYFTFGSAWQAILDYWYMLPQEIISNDNSEDYEIAKIAALSKGYEYWDKASPEAKGENRRENLGVLWDNYIDTYPTEPWRLLEKEIGFMWPIVHTDYFYAGALDGIIEWPSYGRLALEHKTEGSYLSRSVLDKYFFKTQQTGQIWYMYQHEGQMPFGCLVNVVTKKIPGKTSNWTTNRVERLPIRKSKAQLDNFIGDLLWDISDFKRCWDAWHFPMTTNELECVGGVARAPCLFNPICRSGGDYRKAVASHFENIIERPEPWEPWKRE